MLKNRFRNVTLASDVVVQRAGDEAVLLKLDDEVVFSLNPTATLIVELIRSGETVDAIVTRLVNEYDVPRADVAAQVDTLLDSLVSKRLVDVHAAEHHS